ncbi:MAG: radical SAM family heme chaperone HemW [Candidatus Hydrogenedentota bacterium]
MIGVYIHIPFCRVLCPYCDFVKRPYKGTAPERFVDALVREIQHFEGPHEASSVFFGGGTPSVLTARELERVLGAVRERFTVAEGGEIGFEANPDDITPESLAAWKELGVNRLSVGVQNFDDHALEYLGRAHGAQAARQACEWTAEAFSNWGMDLIFGAYPLESWARTLAACRAHAPPHISTYGLSYEPKTPFIKRAHEAVDDDIYIAQYEAAHNAFEDHLHYEVSNFALPGHESQHNLLYWRNAEYAGFGPGAYSFLDGIRSRNLSRFRDYERGPGEKSEALKLSPAEIRVETVIQHFRLREGLEKKAYIERFDRPVEADFGEAIRGLVERGLLEEEDGCIRPTLKGFEQNSEIGLALLG